MHAFDTWYANLDTAFQNKRTYRLGGTSLGQLASCMSSYMTRVEGLSLGARIRDVQHTEKLNFALEQVSLQAVTQRMLMRYQSNVDFARKTQLQS